MVMKILLVDDDQDFSAILSERMMIREIDVTTVNSAKEAFGLVDKFSYDAVILDLQMPEIDGLQALQRLKTIKPDLPIILLTGHATVAKGVEAMKLGAVDVMEKPVDIRVLTQKIKDIGSTKKSWWATTIHSLRGGKER
jgi:DNA-binding NtrC family response regulator